MEIKIYQAEADLADLIKKSNSLSFVSKAEVLSDAFIQKANINLVPSFAAKKKKKSDINNKLLYCTKSILVTSNWNKNDDVFGSLEIWEARNTAKHTPTNVNHDRHKIVGHITDTWVLDENGELISDDTKAEDLPDLIHLCNAAVIYNFYKYTSDEDEDLQEQVETLIEEIEAGEKYVSQECLFPDFDYAVISPENKYYTVSRNEDTAFLTKHLRCYGGDGKYNGYKIGRFIKKMVFSGKGYVDKPANPDSIIFTEEKPVIFTKSNLVNNWLEIEKDGVITINENNLENFSMASENLQEQIDSLKAEKTELLKQLSEANVKQLNETNTGLKTQLDEVSASNSTLSTELKTVKEELTVANSKVAELTKVNEELTEKVSLVEAEKRTTNRISSLVEAGLTREEAEEKVTKFANLDDAQFSVISETIIEAAKMKKKAAKKKAAKKKADCDTKDSTKCNDESKSDESDVLDNAEETEASNAGSVTDDSEDANEDANQLRISVAKIIMSSYEGDE